MKRSLEEISKEYVDSILSEEFSYERKKVFEDWIKKPKVSKGIVSDFKNRVGEVESKKILDIGFGNGLTLKEFKDNGAVPSGLEVSESLYKVAQEVLGDELPLFDLNLYDGFNFPFGNESFDFIYSVSVLEHVTDPVAVLRESYRVLKKGGSFYLAFPNRLNPKETHTGILFANYLPRNLADKYLRLFKRNGVDDYWNLHFLSFFKLKRILKKNNIQFEIQMETNTNSIIKRFIKKLLAFFGVHQSAFLPHVMVILKK